MKILVSAGPTREFLDPVRFLTNLSSGKMGYAVAEALIRAGHEVTLVSGPVSIRPPEGLSEFVPVVSAAQMADAVKGRFPSMNGVVMCAAVADYRPATVSEQKIKKSGDDLILKLERTEDILRSLGAMKTTQILVGFAAETENLREHALGKLQAKNLDWIAANRVGLPGQGFQADFNAAVLYARDGRALEIPLCSKTELAERMIRIIFS